MAEQLLRFQGLDKPRIFRALAPDGDVMPAATATRWPAPVNRGCTWDAVKLQVVV
jgi:hypothetical protein